MRQASRPWRYSRPIRVYRMLRMMLSRKPRVHLYMPSSSGYSFSNTPRFFHRPGRGYNGSGTWHFHRAIGFDWQSFKTGWGPRVTIECQFKAADTWIGIFHSWSGCGSYSASILNVWVCLLPCLPIKISVWEPEVPKKIDPKTGQRKRQI